MERTADRSCCSSREHMCCCERERRRERERIIEDARRDEECRRFVPFSGSGYQLGGRICLRHLEASNLVSMKSLSSNESIKSVASSKCSVTPYRKSVPRRQPSGDNTLQRSSSSTSISDISSCSSCDTDCSFISRVSTISNSEPHYRVQQAYGNDVQIADVLSQLLSKSDTVKRDVQKMPGALVEIIQTNGASKYHCPFCGSFEINEYILRKHLRHHLNQGVSKKKKPKKSLREKMTELFGHLRGGGRVNSQKSSSTNDSSSVQSSGRVTRGAAAKEAKELKKKGKKKFETERKISQVINKIRDDASLQIKAEKRKKQAAQNGKPDLPEERPPTEYIKSKLKVIEENEDEVMDHDGEARQGGEMVRDSRDHSIVSEQSIGMDIVTTPNKQPLSEIRLSTGDLEISHAEVQKGFISSTPIKGSVSINTSESAAGDLDSTTASSTANLTSSYHDSVFNLSVSGRRELEQLSMEMKNRVISINHDNSQDDTLSAHNSTKGTLDKHEGRHYGLWEAIAVGTRSEVGVLRGAKLLEDKYFDEIKKHWSMVAEDLSAAHNVMFMNFEEYYSYTLTSAFIISHQEFHFISLALDMQISVMTETGETEIFNPDALNIRPAVILLEPTAETSNYKSRKSQSVKCDDIDSVFSFEPSAQSAQIQICPPERESSTKILADPPVTVPKEVPADSKIPSHHPSSHFCDLSANEDTPSQDENLINCDSSMECEDIVFLPSQSELNENESIPQKINSGPFMGTTYVTVPRNSHSLFSALGHAMGVASGQSHTMISVRDELQQYVRVHWPQLPVHIKTHLKSPQEYERRMTDSWKEGDTIDIEVFTIMTQSCVVLLDGNKVQFIGKKSPKQVQLRVDHTRNKEKETFFTPIEQLVWSNDEEVSQKNRIQVAPPEGLVVFDKAKQKYYYSLRSGRKYFENLPSVNFPSSPQLESLASLTLRTESVRPYKAVFYEVPQTPESLLHSIAVAAANDDKTFVAAATVKEALAAFVKKNWAQLPSSIRSKLKNPGSYDVKTSVTRFDFEIDLQLLALMSDCSIVLLEGGEVRLIGEPNIRQLQFKVSQGGTRFSPIKQLIWLIDAVLDRAEEATLYPPKDVICFDPIMKYYYVGTPAEGDCFPLAVLRLIDGDVSVSDLRQMTFTEVVNFILADEYDWRLLLAYANGNCIADENDDCDTVIEKYRKYWFSGMTYYQTAEILALSKALRRRIIVSHNGEVVDGQDTAHFNLVYPENETLHIRLTGTGGAGHYEPYLSNRPVVKLPYQTPHEQKAVVSSRITDSLSDKGAPNGSVAVKGKGGQRDPMLAVVRVENDIASWLSEQERSMLLSGGRITIPAHVLGKQQKQGGVDVKGRGGQRDPKLAVVRVENNIASWLSEQERSVLLGGGRIRVPAHVMGKQQNQDEQSNTEAENSNDNDSSHDSQDDWSSGLSQNSLSCSEEEDEEDVNYVHVPYVTPGGPGVARRRQAKKNQNPVAPKHVITEKGTCAFNRFVSPSYLWALTCEGESATAEPLNYGNMDVPCMRGDGCGAVYWNAERLVGRGKTKNTQTPSNCCGDKGQYRAPATATFQVPAEHIRKLYTDNFLKARTFRANILLYNSSFSMVNAVVKRAFHNHRGLKMVHFAGKLTYQGQFEAPSPTDKYQSASHVFLLGDHREAALRRRSLNTHFQRLTDDVLIDFEEYLREKNPYCGALVSTGELLRNAKDEVTSAIVVINPRSTRENLFGIDREHVRKISNRPGVLVPPIGSSLCAVYTSLPASEAYDFVIHCRQNDVEALHETSKEVPRKDTGFQANMVAVKRRRALLDVLCYPLIHLHGEDSYFAVRERIRQEDEDLIAAIENDDALDENDTKTSKYDSLQAYYAHRLMFRPDNIAQGRFSPLPYCQRLLLEYCIQGAIKLEESILSFLEKIQDNVFIDSRRHATEMLSTMANEDKKKIGRCAVLPSSFPGGFRHMRHCYLTALAIHKKTKVYPTMMITLTLDPSAPEIIGALELANQKRRHVYYRPDIVTRTFQMRIYTLMDDMVNKEIMGKCLGWVGIKETQKNTNPHLHVIFFMRDEDVPRTSEQVNAYISAEIPSDPILQKYVLKYSVHPPCDMNPEAPCRADSPQGKCKNGFPRNVQEETILSRSRVFPRRREGVSVDIEGYDRPVNNGDIKPHNPKALIRWGDHFIEFTRGLGSLQYLFGYIFKNHQFSGERMSMKAFVRKEGKDKEAYDWNEIEFRRKWRTMNATQACSKIFGNHEFAKDVFFSHHLVILPVHLEHEDPVVIRGETKKDVEAALKKKPKSRLLGFFELCADGFQRNDPDIMNMKYSDVVEHFRWAHGVWKPALFSKAVGLVTPVEPSASNMEKYALYQLLINVRCPTSYENLLHYAGRRYDTFQEAARARGLIYVEETSNDAMTEASTMGDAASRRLLFVLILLYNNPKNPSELWEAHWKSMIEDIVRDHNVTDIAAKRIALQKIWALLKSKGKTFIKGFHPPTKVVTDQDGERHRVLDLGEEKARLPYVPHSYKEGEKRKSELLDKNQKKAYDEIMAAARNPDITKRVFFLSGPGGSGKTFLAKAIKEDLHDFYQKEAVCSAWSGTASMELPDAQTTCSTYGIPPKLSEDGSEPRSYLRLGTQETDMLASASVHFIDEVSMMKKWQLDVVDGILKNVSNNQFDDFGGQVVVLMGDFKQVLPIVNQKDMEGSVEDNCVFNFRSWSSIITHKFTQNHRAEQDKDYAEWLERVGTGEANLRREPNNIIIPYKWERSRPGQPLKATNFVGDVNQLIDEVFQGDFESGTAAIIGPRNMELDEINNIIINDRLPGVAHSRLSHSVIEKGDEIRDIVLGDIAEDNEDEDIDFSVPDEVASSMSSAGMGPHNLLLKKKAVYMIPTNLCLSRGLVNGTLCSVEEIGLHVVQVKVMNGMSKGQTILLPRIKLTDSDIEHPDVLVRVQFPLRPGYAFTIHRIQGKNPQRVGILLTSPCFSHGMLYVALSRAKGTEFLVMFVADGAFQGKVSPKGGLRSDVKTTNIVDRNILEKAENRI